MTEKLLEAEKKKLTLLELQLDEENSHGISSVDKVRLMTCCSRNIHTNFTEGPWKFGGEKGCLRPNFLEVEYELQAKLEFPDGCGVQTKKLQRRRYGYFLEQHITILK